MRSGVVLETGRKLRRPGGALPALVASTLRTPALTKLAPREQEVATIVYLNTGITAKEVELALSADLTNTAVRSMLNRLVDKGILRRRREGRKFFYSPALLLPDIQQRALQRVVDEFFGGSLADAFRRFVDLLDAAEAAELVASAQQHRQPPMRPLAQSVAG